MRFRELDTRTRTAGSLDQVMCVTGTHNISANNGPYQGDFTQTSDVVVPNFWARKNSGAVLNNPYSSFKRAYSYGGSHVFKRTRSGACSSGSVFTEQYDFMLTATEGPISTSPLYLLDSSTPEVTTLTSAFAGVAPPDIQGLVSLAEMRQTLHMLRHPLESMVKLLSKTKSKKVGFLSVPTGKDKDKHSAGNIAKVSSDTWLEYRYGLLPLMYDVEGICKALSRQMQERKTSRNSILPLSTSSTTTRKRTGALTHYDFDVEENISESLEVSSGVLYAHELQLVNSFGMSLNDVPSAAYELIPFSFAVDWFLNLGTFIDALTPRAGTSVLAAWTKVKRVQTLTRTVRNFKLGPSLSSSYTITTNPNGAYDRCVYTSTWRAPKTRLDTGIRFDLHLTDKRVIDAYALLAQRLRK